MSSSARRYSPTSAWMGNDFCYPQSVLDQTVAQLGGCDVLMNRIGNQCSNAPAFALALGLKINLGVCTPQ